MSTLTEIEAAIEELPAPQLEELQAWLEQHLQSQRVASASEPDFLERAKAIWGDSPQGAPLSALVSAGRG